MLHALEQGLRGQFGVALAQVLTPSAPWVKLTCGIGLMTPFGLPRKPLSTACAQNCRDTWNCSLMLSALEMPMSPSAAWGW